MRLLFLTEKMLTRKNRDRLRLVMESKKRLCAKIRAYYYIETGIRKRRYTENIDLLTLPPAYVELRNMIKFARTAEANYLYLLGICKKEAAPLFLEAAGRARQSEQIFRTILEDVLF